MSCVQVTFLNISQITLIQTPVSYTSTYNAPITTMRPSLWSIPVEDRPQARPHSIP